MPHNSFGTTFPIPHIRKLMPYVHTIYPLCLIKDLKSVSVYDEWTCVIFRLCISPPPRCGLLEKPMQESQSTRDGEVRHLRNPYPNKWLPCRKNLGEHSLQPKAYNLEMRRMPVLASVCFWSPPPLLCWELPPYHHSPSSGFGSFVSCDPGWQV